MSTFGGKKWESPDGGWGYVVAAGVSVIVTIQMGFYGCFGKMLHDFFIELDMDSAHIKLINGMHVLCVSIGGFIASPLIKILSVRKVGALGALFMALGYFCTAFVTKEITMFVCISVTQGLGFGFLFNVTNSIINSYFLKRRLMAWSVIQIVVAGMSILIPQFVKWILSVYGHRGAVIIIGGISLHCFVAVALMQPVTWHMKQKDVEHNSEEVKLILDSNNSNCKINASPISENKDESDISMEEKLGNKMYGNENRIKQIIAGVVDFTELKSFILSNALFGVVLCLFSEVNFMYLLPHALCSMNWSQDNIDLALTLILAVDLATRIALILLNKWLIKFESYEIYIVGLVIGLIAKLGMLSSGNTTVILIFTAVRGISRCTNIILPPIIISYAVKPEQFSSALGIYIITYGVVSFLGSPALEAVKDLTESYATVFYMLSSIDGIIIIFWCIEICYKRNKYKRVHHKNEKLSVNKAK